VAARAVLDRFAWWVALGLANLTNLLDPERIVVGGGLARSADLLLGPVQAALGDLLYARRQRPVPTVVATRLGEQAGARGAARLAQQHRDDPAPAAPPAAASPTPSASEPPPQAGADPFA
jgi:glucokinase